MDLRAPISPRPSLVVGVFNEQYGATGSVTIGPLETGKHSYATSLEGYCVSVCRLQTHHCLMAGSAGRRCHRRGGDPGHDRTDPTTPAPARAS